MKKQLMRAALMSGAVICTLPSFTVTAKGETDALDINSGARAGITSMTALYMNTEYSLSNYVEQYTKGYTTTSVDLRKETNEDSEILETLDFNTEIEYTDYLLNTEWVKVSYNNEIGYIKKEYVSLYSAEFRSVFLPNYSGFKSYMPYTSITNRNTKQYELQQMCYIGTYGIRMYGNRYCVAVGTGVDCEIGDYIDLVLENGVSIPCIVADFKDDEDTDGTNLITVYSNCASEFIVSKSTLDNNVKQSGDISSCNAEWDSKVVIIHCYSYNVFDN